MGAVASYSVRPAVLADFDVVYGFLNTLEDRVFPRDVLYALFQRNISDKHTIYRVAELAGDVVGYISCHGQYLLHHAGLVGEIQELFVRADMRGEGIGRLLVDDVKISARVMNMVQLEVTAHLRRLDTHRFYEQQGFDQTHKKFVYPLTV